MKHNPTATANAAGITTAIVFFVCRAAFVIAPDLSMNIGKSWFHGIDISLIAAQNVASNSFFLGLISATVGAWLVGYLFAVIYNKFVKK